MRSSVSHMFFLLMSLHNILSLLVFTHLPTHLSFDMYSWIKCPKQCWWYGRITGWCSSNCESVTIWGIQCPWWYYVIAELLNRELIKDGQPLFLGIPSQKEDTLTHNWECLSLPCLLRVQLHRHQFMSSCVSADLCCQGAVSHRESPREGGTSVAGQCWCLCNGPWVAAGSLRSLSLDYHCCTHCWSERRLNGLILSVGCTDRGKTPLPTAILHVMGKKGGFLKLPRAVWTVWARVSCRSFLGESGVWEPEVGLGWGTLVCVLAGSLLCVNAAELKETFTERGSVKGMCRMWLGSGNGKDRP